MSMAGSETPRLRWLLSAIVLLVVAIAQLWLVARAGTDVPFQDQWDSEGRGLYPAFVSGSLGPGDLLAPHNEHRILWTRVLDLVLFSANGQWDPLVQLVAGAVLHALVAAGLTLMLTRGLGSGPAWLLAALVALFSLPLAAWHNALWGFQSQVYFVLLLSLAALAVLAPPELSLRRMAAGCLLALAAMFAMGAGLLVPFVLLGAIAWRGLRGRLDGRTVALVTVLMVAAWLLRAEVPEHAALRARSLAEFLSTFLRLLAWPYSDQPWVGLLLNLPLGLLAGLRLAGRRPAPEGESFGWLAAGWGVATLAVTAWSRGGSAEFFTGIPSRYVDIIALLPLLNAWGLLVLVRESGPRERLLGGAWLIFLVAGWLGVALPAWRNILSPRLRDRDAPVRLVRAFQLSGDPQVVAGQPRLLVPHPTPGIVDAVLHDPRLQGRLPPSLQPEKPPGPLSRAARGLLGR
jgi:hypothetical protein